MRRLVPARPIQRTRRWMLLEARLLLLASRLAIRFVPFSRLTWFFKRPAAWPELDGEARAQVIKDVRWAIKTGSGSQPERIVCFPRAVTAQAMLRRRGVSTTLYYGATSRSDAGLHAHVWLQDGEQGIIGRRIAAAAGHQVLARFSTPPGQP